MSSSASSGRASAARPRRCVVVSATSLSSRQRIDLLSRTITRHCKLAAIYCNRAELAPSACSLPGRTVAKETTTMSTPLDATLADLAVAHAGRLARLPPPRARLLLRRRADRSPRPAPRGASTRRGPRRDRPRSRPPPDVARWDQRPLADLVDHIVDALPRAAAPRAARARRHGGEGRGRGTPTSRPARAASRRTCEAIHEAVLDAPRQGGADPLPDDRRRPRPLRRRARSR